MLVVKKRRCKKRKTNLRAREVSRVLPVRVTRTLPGTVAVVALGAVASVVSCGLSSHQTYFMKCTPFLIRTIPKPAKRGTEVVLQSTQLQWSSEG